MLQVWEHRLGTTMIVEELKIFCNETSIHGLNQIANDSLHGLKRFLWLAIFIGCLIYAGHQLSLSIKGIITIQLFGSTLMIHFCSMGRGKTSH